ncbi:hypothetical protein DVA67_007020 [Solirubrobacter sp. CPCC 204708]|uniref:Ig-like domain-containing protein n=1 Tax=Solirubrobacter deserti TaxID=2282478 RepID=A0ABT4RPH5_9ACTN|nr:Ig-like domain-containing protein [Solirubrobacter deserti]MBE2315720.1 hypothetical protein [Solirubrobacter deserti]MDA0140390.1 Ig-like domain-containing protein [Solirubrobacter deserti]
MKRSLLVVGVVVSSGLVGAAPAGAATLTLANGTLTYVAGAGASNNLAFSGDAAQVIVERRIDTDADVIAGAGCTGVPEGERYACAGVSRVVVEAGDGADRVDAPTLAVPITINGGEGIDALTGGSGADAISGGPGDDQELGGGAGADVVDGGVGDDLIGGGSGPDALGGGPGLDRVSYSSRPSVTVTLDGAANDGSPGEGDNVLGDVEDVTLATTADGAASLIGDAGGNFLDVDGGPATIDGAEGADVIYGSDYNDTINARDGFPDRIYCNAGTDTAVLDQFDVVSACENAPVVVVAGAPTLDDAPPVLTWTAPAARVRFRGDVPPVLSVNASDDRGVAKVQFYDDDRFVCEALAPPYACTYTVRGADVGSNTLTAVAIDGARQQTSAVRVVTVTRFRPRLSLTLRPSRDRRMPYRFVVRGRLASAGACSGRIRITVKSGRRTVSARRTALSRQCRYSIAVSFPTRVAARLRFGARFEGNASTLPRSAKVRSARLG